MARNVILHAEDDPDDLFFVRRFFQKRAPEFALQQVKDGEEAMQYLTGAGCYADREKYPLPNAVLLDIKLPLRDGMEVLQWARHREDFQALPIVVLTNSDLTEDMEQAKSLGATAYLTKTADCENVLEAVRKLLPS